MHPDGHLSHTWPPRATPIPPPPRRSPETGGRQIRIPKPNFPPVLVPSERTHPKSPRSHKRGFEFSPRPWPPFRCTGPDGNPPEPTQGRILSPKYPSARTTPQRYLAGGATAPKCRRALSLVASTDALPSRAAPDPKCGGSPASRSNNNPHPRNPPTPHQHSSNGNSQPPLPQQHNEAV